MFHSSTPRIHGKRIALMLFALLMGTSAGALEVTGGFTGWWGQPEQQNHGVIVAVSRLPSGEKTGVLYWAHYDEQGNPSWLFAQGDIEDDTIVARVFQFDGITFMQDQEDGVNFGEQVGTMEVTFSDCLNGTVVFDTTVVGSGEFPIARLTNQPGAQCSGGLSDDFGPNNLPQEFEIALASTGLLPDASGHAELDLRPGRADFSVGIKGVPAGDYELQIDGEAVGSITAEESDDGVSGRIEFRSPVTPGKELLDFDPRGAIIDVLFEGEVVLTALAPEQGDFMGNGPPPFDTPATGSLVIEAEFENLGVFPEGAARAAFEMSGPRVDFDVEVEDIPAGTYPLFVDGIKRGDIVVTEGEDGTTSGELEFRFPPSAGQSFFDFDPRGKRLEIIDGATVLFALDFPTEGEPGETMTGGAMATTLELDNSGVLADAEATAQRFQTPAFVRFEVELSGAPVGDYAVNVGGVERGTLSVIVDDDGDTFGRLRFRDPAVGNHLPLDFEPRGALIEILADGTVVFSGTFPE